MRSSTSSSSRDEGVLGRRHGPHPVPADRFLQVRRRLDGDGHRDIWNSIPDALASAASQLVAKGWDKGKRWGFEVKLPANVDCSIAEPDTKARSRNGSSAATCRADAQAVARELGEQASLFLPAGLNGPAFLTLKNFYVFKGYNFADLYALFVGNLSDRIAGGQTSRRPGARSCRRAPPTIENDPAPPDAKAASITTRSTARPG